MSAMFHQIHQALLDGRELAVATIIGDRGSTPRTSGSKMIVYRNGGISGTIGGGAVEGDVIQRAMGLFETRGAQIVSYDLSRKANLRRMDVICGGWMQILIEHVSAYEKNIELYNAAQKEIKMSRSFFWIGKITDVRTQLEVTHAILKAGNGYIGPSKAGQAMRRLVESMPPIATSCYYSQNLDHTYVIESIRPPDTLFLFGAGHVARQIAAIGQKVGFRIVVVDDRVEFANADRFPDADRILVRPGFTEVFNGFSTHPGDLVVIVTRGHRFDKAVLAQALHTQAGYIGMIGSRRKRETIYRELMDQGVSTGALEQVHCPLGLSICAETPAEIALSVVAQLIQHRTKLKIREEV